jgi:small basic protein (TIGR04137 family)
MSMDRSLKTGGALTRHRNVLTRAERLKKLTDEERWGTEKSVFGLPKVSNRTAKVGKKTKKKEEGAEAAAAPGAPGAAPGAAPAAAGAAAKPAAGAAAKPAAPAKGGKEAKK